LFSSLLVFLVLFLFRSFVFNIHFLDPISNAFHDFKLSDIYYSKLIDHEKTTVDTNIVIVNIGENSREDIAKQIEIIDKFQPKVIGLDVVFEERKNPLSDIVLREAISNAHNIVLANYLNYPESDHGNNNHHDSEAELVGSHEFFSQDVRSGYVNFVAESDQSTIRKYAPFVELHEHEYLSFTSHLIKDYNQKAFEKLSKRHNEVEIINYKRKNNKYIILDVDEIKEENANLNILKDKIVLLGYLGPDLHTNVIEDNHYTPLNPKYNGKSLPDMYGVVIHANILSMILENGFVTKLKSWLVLFLSFIILYLHMYYFIKYYVHRHIWYHVFAKFVQLLTSVIIVGIEIYILSKFNFTLNSSLIIIPIILSIDVLYFYDGIVKFLHKKFNYNTWFLEH
jgi:CHASE2 domain-containing sensor protein